MQFWPATEVGSSVQPVESSDIAHTENGSQGYHRKQCLLLNGYLVSAHKQLTLGTEVLLVHLKVRPFLNSGLL